MVYPEGSSLIHLNLIILQVDITSFVSSDNRCHSSFMFCLAKIVRFFHILPNICFGYFVRLLLISIYVCLSSTNIKAYANQKRAVYSRILNPMLSSMLCWYRNGTVAALSNFLWYLLCNFFFL